MIQLNHVTKTYNQSVAVSDVSFEVKAGDTLVLLGTSGSGKTTTLRVINRLEQMTKGEILVNGKSIEALPVADLRRGIGYVLQHHGLFPHYTVAQNIGLVPSLLKWADSEIKERTFTLLRKLQLPESVASLYPHQLSGGQQQRVGLARALAVNPPVLLMDEPFGALDPITRTAVRRELSQLDELENKTVIMVTHDVQEAFEMGDQICLMDKGAIVQMGTPEALLFAPANDFVTAFLAEQKLRLQFEHITISNLWHLLPGAAIGSATAGISPNTTLWQLLQILDDSSQQKISVSQDGTHKTLTTETVMSAYFQYKNHLQS